MRSAFVLAGAACLAALVLASPQAQGPAAGPGAASVALTGARLIDGTGRPPIERATLLLRGGRIEAVGAADAVTIPAGATRVDLAGRTLTPGLVNAHAHVSASDESTRPVRDQLVSQLRLYASYGVTTAFVLGSSLADLQDALRLRDEQEQGTLDRSRLFVCSPSAREVTTVEQARQRAGRDADLKVDCIKMHINGTPGDMTPAVYGTLIEEAHKRGVRVAAHLYYASDAWGLLKAGVDVFAHSVRDRDVDPEMVAALKRQDVAYIPTLTRELSVFVYETTPPFFSDPFFLRHVADYRAEMTRLSDPALQARTRASKQAQAIKQALAQASRNLKILADAGVPIAMGTDSGAGDGRWQGYFEHVELELMVKAGLTPMQAIVAATGGAARAMRIDRHVGTLEPGKWADLIVLQGNPLADIRNTRAIESVWIAGHRLVGAN